MSDATPCLPLLPHHRLPPLTRVLALGALVAGPAYGFALATAGAGPATLATVVVAVCAAVPVLVVNVAAAVAWLDLRRSGVDPVTNDMSPHPRRAPWGRVARRCGVLAACAAGTAVTLAVATVVAAVARVSTWSGAGIVLLGAEAALLAGVCGCDLWRSGRPDAPPVSDRW